MRVVLLGVATVVFATAGWMIHLNSLRQAEQTLREAVRLGEAALVDEDLDEAMRRYQQARAALVTLGRDDPEARGVRQTALELTALSQLAPRSLHDMVAEAAEMSAAGSTQSWAISFRTNYRDTWVVLDTRVSRRDKPDVKSQFVIELPVFVKSIPARVVGNLKAFDRLPQDSQSHRVIFAAQLVDCRRDTETEEGWEIVLSEESGFLWCRPAHFRMLTGTLDQPTEQVLVEQSRAVGVSP